MSEEHSRDVGLSLEQEIHREMFLSMDRVLKEIKERFDQLHALPRKYSCITPCNLLNEEVECEINDFIDIENSSILKEKESRFLWLSCVGKTGGKALLIY